LIDLTWGSGPEARSVTFQYNAEGYLKSITDPLSNVLGFEYDKAGRIKKQILPDGRESIYSYDPNGNVASITPPGRPSHSFQYNAGNLMLEYDPPDAVSTTDKTTYSYNKDRQLAQILRPDGLAIDFAYDAGGRLSTITTPDGPVTYAYDPVKGYRIGISRPGGNSLSYAYDGTLVMNVTWQGVVTGSVSWTYDNSLRVTGIRVNAGSPIAYQYDNDKLLTNAGDLILTRDAQNGFLTAATLGSVNDSWAYDIFGYPATYTAKYDDSDIYQHRFTYDKLGRITQKVETVDSVTNTYEYVYDPAGRLTEVTKNGATLSTYTYDGNDNRLSYAGTGGPINGTYDDQDRLVQYGTTTYSYTANGELKSKTTGAQTTQYAYDVFGNLTGVTLPDGRMIEYVVDGMDRRIGKRLNGTWVRKFLYLDDLKPIAELDGESNIVSLFVFGRLANVPDYLIKGGATYRLISDHLGSPRLVVNVADGTVAQRIDYDEFGKVLSDTNPDFQPFGFAGGVYDSDTKLLRFGARDYDAQTGRWTTKDPLLFDSGQMNLYAYVSNDPINRTDSKGLKPQPMQEPKLNPSQQSIQNELLNLLMSEQYCVDVGISTALQKGLCFREVPDQIGRPGRHVCFDLSAWSKTTDHTDRISPVSTKNSNSLCNLDFENSIKHFIEEGYPAMCQRHPSVFPRFSGP
jgi:RHS repeat-associated protein